MAYSNIHDLNSSKDDWVVQVRLCRLWEAVNVKEDNTLLGLELLFADDKGDSIQAFIRKNHIRKYKSTLEEGNVYAVKNFKVARATMAYKVVSNEIRIYFTALTTVRKLTDGPHKIPDHVFSFTSASIHQERIRNNLLLTEIIGYLVGGGPVEHLDNTKQSIKRELELAPGGDDPVMQVTLWGNIAETFDYTVYMNSPTPVIAVVTSTTVKRYNGALGYNSSTATRLYVNPPIPETKLLTSRFAGRDHTIRVLQSEQMSRLPLADQIVLNRRTVEQILNMTWVSDTQETVFTVLATIKGIKRSYGWTYISCNVCKAKVVPENGIFYCPPCNKECSYPIIRYKIHLHVDDGTENTTFVVFDEDAQKLLKHPAKSFVARLGIGNMQFPREIEELIGKTYVFKIKLSNYNLKDGFENYSVSKIFEIDQGIGSALPVSLENQTVVAETMVSSLPGPSKKTVDGNEKKRSSAVMFGDKHVAGLQAPTGNVPPAPSLVDSNSPAGLITPDKREKKKLSIGSK